MGRIFKTENILNFLHTPQWSVSKAGNIMITYYVWILKHVNIYMPTWNIIMYIK